MATAHMQRPYPPSIYNTPQSNSPASVSSSQAHDAQSRAMFAQSQSQPQPQPQMSQNVYAGYVYPNMGPVHAGPYAPHHAQSQQQQQQQAITSQPVMMSHQHQQPSSNIPQQQQTPRTPSVTASPGAKLEPSAMPLQRPLDRPTTQRSPPGPVSSGSAPSSSHGIHQSPGGSNATSNAAPGPIPATTPLVVRQDNNGVQWIAFEYSRDRVKMEYTIRCDVESVNTESLDSVFKTENCVYPRAVGTQDQYRGNRYNYETECNNVGWSLAELNPCLRGKRGLIQRAVDSWRNSNQDPKLRSRRVRRQAKTSVRKQSNPSLPSPVSIAGVSSASSMAAPSPYRQTPTSSGYGTTQLHHHHNQSSDGSTTGVTDDMSGMFHHM